MIKHIRTLWLWLTCYMVAVKWETVNQVKFFKREDEALEWARLYPYDASVMIGKRGKLLMARW